MSIKIEGVEIEIVDVGLSLGVIVGPEMVPCNQRTQRCT